MITIDTWQLVCLVIMAIPTLIEIATIGCVLLITGVSAILDHLERQRRL